MELQDFLFDVTDDGIATLTFNRPDDLNPLTHDALAEMNAVIDEVRQNDAIRVLILTGSGRAFSAGADVKKFHEGKFREAGEAPLFFQLHKKPDVVPNLENLLKPVIAAVNGVAVGEGVEIALAADFRLLSDKAKMGFPEAKIGLIPASGGCSRIVKHLGLMRAKELYLGGEIMSAQEALAAGLATKVVPHDQLMDEATDLARRMLAKAPLALATAKAVLNACVDTDMAAGHVLELMAQTVLMATDDHLEGIQAFVQKRDPKFVGR
ncbi:MAG TPA: enoyl-CoA hydratase/isomerase family protein [Acidimicrobiales bacterium]|nr:enoyl-CoA hydratase/isomerase family protein [Acidimicrobiales bacterium]